jgi:large subunit ribosomal protein L33
MGIGSPSPRGVRGGQQAARTPIALACEDCKARNYKTSRSPDGAPVELKKFCKHCKRHTVHRETK